MRLLPFACSVRATAASLALVALASCSTVAPREPAPAPADDRLVQAVEALPPTFRAEADRVVAAVTDSPEAQALRQLPATLDARLGESSAAMRSLAEGIERARATAQDLGRAVEAAEGIDTKGLTEFAGELRNAAAEIHATLPDAQATIAELKLTIEAAERVSTALRDLTRGPDGKPLDLTALSAASERFAVASSDLRSAIGQANQILASDEATRRLEEIARTGRAGIDHAIWRVGQLLVIIACLAIVVRIAWVLTRPRAEIAARPARR
ncbi:MAG: hypothetical protein U0572_11685 [Phycisphaerales bacterium]